MNKGLLHIVKLNARKWMFLLTILCSFLGTHAQQNPLYSQFIFNPFVVNPALAGSEDFYQIWMQNRLQWIGIPDAPVTNSISVFGPMNEENMGIGGVIFSDVAGATSNLGFKGSYSYSLDVMDDLRVSFGLSLGLLQYKIDYTQITFSEEFDNVQQDGAWSKVIPDAAFGIYVTYGDLKLGLAANQLFNNNLKIFDIDTVELSAVSRLTSHYYLSGSYRYNVTDDLALEPGLVVRSVRPVSPQVDINLRAIYQQKIFTGIQFRTQESVSILAGYTHEDKIQIGLSYDITVGDIAQYRSTVGSFEVVLGYRFDVLKSKTKPKDEKTTTAAVTAE